MEIIRKDADFFGETDLIDYSLLVGVHDKALHKDEENESQSQFDKSK